MMWRQQHHKEAGELNADNRKAFNRTLREKLEAMSPSDLSKTQTAMQADWDALTPEKKTKLSERIAAKARQAADKLASTDADADDDDH